LIVFIFMKIIGIYKISNPLNKIYIGQSINITYRNKQYKSPSNYKNQTKLRNSINKYGLDNHKFEVIEECETKELNNRERYWQNYYDSFKNGLNCKLTTSNDKSGEVSQATKDMTSKKLMGHVVLKTTKDKIGLANTGRIISEETRDKLSKNCSRWNAKLSDIDVHNICQMYISGKTTQDIYEVYPNVHYVTLSEIRRKKVYKHITSQYNINKPSKRGCKRKTIKRVICVEDNLAFDGIYKAAKYYKVSFQSISKCALLNKKIEKINKTFKYENQ
jgi:group I intron endonuclease